MTDPVVLAKAALASIELFQTEFKSPEQLFECILKFAEEHGKNRDWVLLQFWDHSTADYGDWALETILKVAIAVKEKLVSKTLASSDQIKFAQHAVAFLYNSSLLKDDQLGIDILGGKADEDQVAKVIEMAFENGWDGEAPPEQEKPQEKKQEVEVETSKEEMIPFLDEDRKLDDAEVVERDKAEVLAGERKRLPEDARYEEPAKNLPAPAPRNEIINLVKGEDGIWHDAATGEVMMTEEEALAALRVTKPKFEIVDALTAEQYVGWLRELQNKTIDYVDQAVARIGEVLTTVNSISYYYNPSLRAVVLPMLKKKGDGSYAAKNVKLPTGTVFFGKRGGPVVLNHRELREWAENVPKSQWSFYGITEETKIKIDLKKIKELVASGTKIAGTANIEVDEVGLMKIGTGRSGWSLKKVRDALKPLNAKLKSLRFIEFGKIATIKEERVNDFEEDEEDFE